MNLFPKIFRNRHLRAWTLLTLAVGIGVPATTSFGQGLEPLGAPNASTSESNDFAPAAPELGRGFPSSPIHFDPQLEPVDSWSPAEVNSGNFEIDNPAAASGVEAPVPSTADESPQAMLQSATAMWTRLSSSLQSQWQQGGWSQRVGAWFGRADIGRMLGSLALVVGGYLSLVWIFRVLVPGADQRVPAEVLEVLGSVPLEPRKHLQILRLGSKLLLLIHGPDGTHPIGEINDPEEVAYLTSLCPGRRRPKGQRLAQLRAAARAMTRATPPSAPRPAPPAPRRATTAASESDETAGSHLAAILQSLNGPRSGNAAVFEA